jgi:imidazolonepropionase-like amidohydrolase
MIRLIALVATLSSVLPAQGALPGAATQPLALVGVHVVPMDTARVLRDQTVIIRDGRIAQIGPRGRVVTAGTRVLQLQGMYVAPGLADLHTHPELDSDLTHYVAHGVTTILTLGSFADTRLLQWRDSIRRGQRTGPDIYIGYYVDGPGAPPGRVVSTPDEGRAAARDARSRSFDFMKAYNSIPESAFVAMLQEAATQGVPVTGHGVRSVGLERGFALGQVMVAHAEEYLYTTFNRVLDSTRFADIAGWTKQSGAYVLPNLSAYFTIARQWGKPPVVDTFLQSPEARSLGNTWRERWRGRDYIKRQGSLDARTVFLSRFIKVLSDSGVPLLAGTDSPTIPGVFPGSSIVLDLRLLVQAGLTPYQALATATRNAGDFLNRYAPTGASFGRVAPGQRADLVVLQTNPLQDIEALARPAAVILRGHYHTRAQLDARVAALAAADSAR